MEAHEPDADRFDVQLAVAGDTSAFERLYRRHVARVHTRARRLLGDNRADDATQEIFLRAWRRLPSFRGEGAFAAWLHALARNWLLSEIERRRGRAGQAELEALPAEPSAPAREPEREVDLDAALRRLPAGARNVLALRHFGGCSHEEIARLLGISVGTSKSQLHRARCLLRGLLEPAQPGSEEAT